MRSLMTFTLAALALLTCLNTAGAATYALPPDWNPMIMFKLDMSWANPADHSQGGTVKINNKTYASQASPHTPPVQPLVGYDWPLVTGPMFVAGDVFASPYHVLNGTSWARHYGWFSYTDLPANLAWKIVITSASPGFRMYDPYSASFNQLCTPASGYAVTYNQTYDLVNGVVEATDAMFHPVFVAPSQTGSVFVDFAIYLSNADGSPIAGITPAYERFNFSATPSAATPGDANLDGRVDDNDLGTLLSNWGAGTIWQQGNFKYTGAVDDNDLGTLLGNWTGRAAAAPEPVSLALIVAGAASLWMRRR